MLVVIRIGIYGYECTKEAILNGYIIVPLYTNYSDVRKLANDENYYHLTAFLELIDTNNLTVDEFIFDLEAVLSFAVQKDVLIRNKLNINECVTDLGDDYPLRLEGAGRRTSRTSVVTNDTISPDSRAIYIGLAMKALASNTSESKSFRKAFFKVNEVFKARQHFIDVSYYLLFSALESLCRSIKNDFASKNCAKPIMLVLNEYGFDIQETLLSKPHQSFMTYVHLRNALFHNGLLEKEVNTPSGETVIYRQSEFYSTFSRLIPLVILKYIDFDDGFIDWNGWVN
ncbi:hypothetical protein [Shewanella pneumatophori]|uniref:Uncharacterized protein n=1 Tax=Shewanella pneumatophori TaxID=314092 RepID=A0A9X2CFU7_9GAMM|nr:hypothetical protein [Shewanella pneumatophori]MCL1140297.1 hypothetical protein [Shewanella pneumatophori]